MFSLRAALSPNEPGSPSPSPARRGSPGLQVTTTLLGQVLAQVGEGVVVADAEGRFVAFNPAAQRLIGRGPADLPTESWPDHYRLYQLDGETLFTEDELPLVRALRGEEVEAVEMLIRRADDSAEDVTVLVRSWPLRGEDGELIGGIATLHVVSEARRTERRLRASEARYRALTELVSDHATSLKSTRTGA